MNHFVPFYFDGSHSKKDGLSTSVRNMTNWGNLVAAAIQAGISEKIMQAQLGSHQEIRGLPTFGFNEQNKGYDGETLRVWLDKNNMFLPTATIIAMSPEKM